MKHVKNQKNAIHSQEAKKKINRNRSTEDPGLEISWQKLLIKNDKYVNF
jgi:hypothetical protein